MDNDGDHGDEDGDGGCDDDYDYDHGHDADDGDDDCKGFATYFSNGTGPIPLMGFRPYSGNCKGHAVFLMFCFCSPEANFRYTTIP